MKNAGKLKTTLMLGVMVLLCANVQADPPSRVGRLTDLSGTVSFSPAGETQWVNATRNRPLVQGDRLWTDKNARSLVQLGQGSTVCLKDNTYFNILHLSSHLTQFQLTQGTLKLQINQLAQGQAYEINTPNVALVISRPGDYRLEVDEEATAVTVIHGQAQAYGKTESFFIDNKKTVRFSGDDLQYKILHFRASDVFDRWCTTHLATKDDVKAALYVASSVIGYEDLDTYGTWQMLESYGPAWTPLQVSAQWAPYQQGTWVWIEPWGWSWVGGEPWGFAPYHYGRWTYVNNRWYWVPGPQKEEAIYAPALVAFMSQELPKSQLPEMIAWFPLAPGEIYWPVYQVSRGYFYEMNKSNTLVRNTELIKAYENPQPLIYQNLSVPDSVTGVPAEAFTQPSLLSKTKRALSSEVYKPMAVFQTAMVAPTYQSVLGNEATQTQPSDPLMERLTLLKTPLSYVIPSFASKQKKLNEQPGKPLDPLACSQIKSQANTPRLKVAVIQASSPDWVTPSIANASARLPATLSNESTAASNSAQTQVEVRDFYPQANEPLRSQPISAAASPIESLNPTSGESHAIVQPSRDALVQPTSGEAAGPANGTYVQRKRPPRAYDKNWPPRTAFPQSQELRKTPPREMRPRYEQNRRDTGAQQAVPAFEKRQVQNQDNRLDYETRRSRLRRRYHD